VAGVRVKGSDSNNIRPDKFAKVLDAENEDPFWNIKVAGYGMKVTDNS